MDRSISKINLQIIAAYREEQFSAMHSKLLGLTWDYPKADEDPVSLRFFLHTHDFEKSSISLLEIEVSIMGNPEHDKILRDRITMDISKKERQEYFIKRLERRIEEREHYLRLRREKGELASDEREIRIRIIIKFKDKSAEEMDNISFDINDIDELNMLHKALQILEEIRTIVCYSLITYSFNSDKFIPVGGLELPMKLPLGEELEKRLGVSKLATIVLEMEESPLGLQQIHIKGEESEYRVQLIFKSKGNKNIVDEISDLLRISDELSRMLVVEK